MGKDVFISFSNKDKEEVGEVVKAIEKLGVSCWFQTKDTRPDFLAEVYKGIQESKAFVLFLSSNAIKSDIVKNEVCVALDKRKRLGDESKVEDSDGVLSSLDEYKILPVDLESPTALEDFIILIGSFNRLDYGDYKNDSELAMFICKQLGFNNKEIRESTYSLEVAVERERLAYQGNILKLQISPTLDKIYQTFNAPNILDLGCFDGKQTFKKFEGRRIGKYVGLDKKIDINDGLPQGDNISFFQCDLSADDYSQKLKSYMNELNIKTFDILHLSFLLLHLSDIEKLLSSLKQFMSEDSYLIIHEVDDDATIVYPHSKFFEDWKKIWNDASDSGNRTIGREIPLHLKRSGFTKVTLENSIIASSNLDAKHKEAFWNMLYNPDFWIDSTDNFSDIDAYSALESYREDYDKHYEGYMAGDIFIGQGIFLYTAQI